MKIVHSITSFERGGAQVVLEILVRALADQGHTQVIIYLYDGPYRQVFEQMGVPVYKVGGLISSFDPVSFYRLYHLIKEIKPDIIHSLLWATNFMVRAIARKLGIPCVLSLHNNLEQNGRVRNTLDRLVSYQSHRIVAVSSEVKDSFYAYQPGREAVDVIENGIDCELLARVQPLSREMFGLLPDHFVIGSVGRLVPLKRYPLLFDAFALLLKRCANVRLVIIGTGHQEKELRAYALTIGIDHALVWIINKPALPYYLLFDCFALTSAKEGISMALLEAMGLGIVPIVTYDTLTHPVISDMHNGIVAHGKNATGVADILERLWGDRELRKKLSGNAQRTIWSRFAKKRMIAAYLALFESTLQQEQNR